MINFLLGAPGGGKSYEATVFHILPALAKGRKVITNLPLNLEVFPPEQRDLIEIRKPEGLVRPFSQVQHYGDPWRHIDKGFGPLYVIDECHLCLPRGGTPKPVAEWFSLHRHEFADVLLISQSYGKVDKDICDLVQVVYRVRKAVAFGSTGKYIRKVFDGLKGDLVNTSIRNYEKKYFKFYKSHTLSQGDGKEEGANDIVPIWKRWPFIFAPLLLITAAVLFMRNGANIFEVSKPKATGAAAPQTTPAKQAASARMSTPTEAPAPFSDAPPVSPPAEDSQALSTETETAKPHPFASHTLHVVAHISNPKRSRYVFDVAQNGHGAFFIDSDELAKAGYKVKYVSDCIARISFDGMKDFFALCDSPRIGLSPGKNVPGAEKDKG